MMAGQILVLTHEFPPRRGGIATYIEETVRAAARAGWPVTVLAPRQAIELGEPGVRVVPTTARGTQDWPDRLRLLRALRAAPVEWDRTLLWLPEPAPIRLWIYGGLLPLPRPARLVLTLHGSEILRIGAIPHRRERFARLLHRADRVGVVSEAVERLAAAVADPTRTAFVRVPGAVHHGLLAALGGSSRPAPAGPPWRVLTVARIHPRKGQREVVEALGRLPAGLRENVIYQLVGPVRRPRYLAALQARAAQLGVRLEGPTELPDAAALARAYARADLAVLASRVTRQSIEGFGLVYLEAAAAGCPVLATAAGGAREAVGPDNGLVIPPDDPDALRDALQALLTDPSRRLRLGAAGPAWAARFSWDRVAERLFGSPGAR